MATLQELESALINADRAGDSTAAKMLADEIRQQRRMGALNPSGGYTGGVRSQVIDLPEPNPLERMGRGFKDFGMSAAQLALPKEKAAELTRGQDEEIKQYEKGRGPGAGFDFPRFVGASLPAVPIAGGLGMAAEGALGAATMAAPVARATLGAVQGATQGGLTYTPEGGSKGTQVALGAGAGAVAPFVMDAISSVAARIGMFGKEAAARFSANPEAIVAELEPVLAAKGIKWAELTDEVKKGMLAQARKQLTVAGDLSPDAIARKADLEDLMGPGAGPTNAQVTRDPQQWSWERNTQKLPGDLGQPMTQRLQAQVQRLRDLADEAVGRMGGRARNDFQAGTAATEAVQQKMADSKRVVDDLYSAWRETGAGATEVKPQRLASELGVITDEIGIGNIPAEVRARLESFGMGGGKQTKVFTIDEAEKLRKLIGNNDPGPQNRTASMASQRLKRALDESVMDTESPDIPALKAARSAARERFEMRDSGAGVAAAAEQDAPDRFFTKYVMNGNVGDLQGLKATLNTGVTGAKPTPGMQGYEPAGGQAWKDLKTRTLEYAVEKATVKDGAFSGAQFKKALNEIGEERLKVLFEPDELKNIMRLNSAARDLTTEPAFAAVNHSNTAATGAQYLGDAASAIPRLAEAATGIPFLGKMAAGAWSAGDQVAKNAEMRRRVGQALMGDAFDPTMAVNKRQQLAQLLSGKLGPLGSAAAVGAAEFNPWTGTQ